jgi:hypothetical protein
MQEAILWWAWFCDEHAEIQDSSRVVMKSEESNKILLNETWERIAKSCVFIRQSLCIVHYIYYFLTWELIVIAKHV